MYRIYIGFLILLISFATQAQFGGGDGDGFSRKLSPEGCLLDQSAFCSGGDGDGFNRKLSPEGCLLDQSAFCSGGDGDGFVRKLSTEGPILDQTAYCSGGDGDGFDLTFSLTGPPLDQSAYCSGGEGDGFDLIYSLTGTLPDQAAYCSGGEGDGFDLIYSLTGPLADQTAYCSGGDGDGFTIQFFDASPLGLGIWTGLVNSVWTNPGNWEHNTIPDIDIDVNIPDNCPNYPVADLTIGIDTTKGDYRCQSFKLLDGASLTALNTIYINGDMEVSGNLEVNLDRFVLMQVNVNGRLTVDPTGYIHLGLPDGGRSIGDFRIQDGGEVSIEGGTLEVDDKLKVFGGGELRMSSGEIFVGKYGLGSNLSDVTPAAFYIMPGAIGGISGGDLKICGIAPDGNNPGGLEINEPTFHITDSATVILMHGDIATHFNTGLETVDGAQIQSLIINKPGNTIFLRSNLHILEDLILEPNASFEIETGKTLSIGP